MIEAWKRLSTSHETIDYQWSLEASKTTVSQISFRLLQLSPRDWIFLAEDVCVVCEVYLNEVFWTFHCLITLALVFLTFVFPAVAGSEHLRM